MGLLPPPTQARSRSGPQHGAEGVQSFYALLLYPSCFRQPGGPRPRKYCGSVQWTGARQDLTSWRKLGRRYRPNGYQSGVFVPPPLANHFKHAGGLNPTSSLKHIFGVNEPNTVWFNKSKYHSLCFTNTSCCELEFISTPFQFRILIRYSVTVLICQTSSSLLGRTSHDLSLNKLMIIIYWWRGPRCNLAKVTFITPNRWQQQIKAAPSFPSSAA